MRNGKKTAQHAAGDTPGSLRKRLADGKSRLLTLEEERQIGCEMRAHVEATKKAAESAGVQDVHDIDTIFSRYATPEGLKLRDRFVRSNLGLVIAHVRNHHGQSVMPIEDLMQEGGIGLMCAALRYDERRGVRFSTYATWWIRQRIGHAITRKARLIRIPSQMLTFSRRVDVARAELRARLGREPHDEEVAQALHAADKLKRREGDHGSLSLKALIKNIRRIQTNLRQPLSLDRPIATMDEGGATLGESVPSEEAEETPPWTTLIPEAAAARLKEAIQALTPLERKILKLRYGLKGGNGLTYKEIGAICRLSGERIRQIDVQLMRKLRKSRGLGAILSEIRTDRRR